MTTSTNQSTMPPKGNCYSLPSCTCIIRKSENPNWLRFEHVLVKHPLQQTVLSSFLFLCLVICLWAKQAAPSSFIAL